MSKYMYIVSDSYLHALKKESDAFTFRIKGYCSIKHGMRNLPFVNMEDILGFVIAYHELPEELDELIEYINFLNSICDKPVVLFSYFKEGISILLEHIEYNNLKFYVSTGMEAVTDVVIKREIYGSILKEVYEPYVRVKPMLIQEDRIAGLTHKIDYYKPILNLDIEKVLSTVANAPSYEKSLSVDIALSDFEESPILKLLRTKVIQNAFKINRNLRDNLELLLVDVSLEKKIMYKSLYNIIERGEY